MNLLLAYLVLLTSLPRPTDFPTWTLELLSSYPLWTYSFLAYLDRLDDDEDELEDLDLRFLDFFLLRLLERDELGSKIILAIVSFDRYLVNIPYILK